jgi:hypothetical protein
MSDKYEALKARFQEGEEFIDGGYYDQEAFLIASNRLLIYSKDGWQYEFRVEEIQWDLLETSNQGKFLEIIDMTDPAARVYHFSDLYNIADKIITALERV